jgi:predicted transcriptional regulator
MKETDPKRKIEAYMKRTGLKAYQVADLCSIPRVSIYRFLSGSRDLKLAQWRSVSRLIDRQ